MMLSTGIREVDRTLGGGLPAGSLVVLTSPPEAQVGPLLNAGIHVRPSIFLTTIRTASAIRNELDRLLSDPQIKDIRSIGTDGGLVEILAGIEQLEAEEDVIVDVIDPLESAADQQAYVTFLDDFARRLQETDSIGIVHCLGTDDPPRNRSYTLAAADFVWEFDYTQSGSKLEYTLTMPKASGLTLSEDDRVLELDIGRSVSIDTSRDIA